MMNPERGHGKRALGCEWYDQCLYHAAKLDWESFRCDSCTMQPESKKTLIESLQQIQFDVARLVDSLESIIRVDISDNLTDYVIADR